ncbi:myst histone acetyltransferase [Jimgerdemannia flammicorona]|uniref:histone acetyltransferase n=2 Tax=Jimgerdemannia flammicorona TaxID=994334 RepID=A0A433QYL4_9FUNG|nr:myst histone acetyltransferase [Jimgerdemannia flammicorona]
MLGLARHLPATKMIDKATKRSSRKTPEIASDVASIVVGSFHMVKWKDELYKAEIIERRQDENDDEPQFYVHYCGYDRRLDEWVPEKRISPAPVTNDAPMVEPAVLTPPTSTVSAEENKELDKRRSRRIAKRKRSDLESEDMVILVNDSPFRPASQPAIPPPPSPSPPEPQRRPLTRRRTSSSTPALAQQSTSAPTFPVTTSSTHQLPLPATAAQITLTPIDILEKEREQATKVRNINSIIFGKYEIATWYYSPYPDEYGDAVDKLWICEFCMKYMKEEAGLRMHRIYCKNKKLPGRVIYTKDAIKIYEIDGKQHKLYCQNLCLLAKLFLDHKTLYYDVEGFLFYVLTEEDERERFVDHVVGYFSKEKISYDSYNLACILILPPHQRKGYGRLLIEFSYELSKKEHAIGSPEKPLSDLGLLGYQSYWASVLLGILRSTREGAISIRELSRATSIREEDVISTLSRLGLLKYWSKVTDTRDKEKERQEDDDVVEEEDGEQYHPYHYHHPRQAHQHPQHLHQDQQPIAMQSPPHNHPRPRQPVCVTMVMVEEAITEKKIRLERMIDPEKIIWAAPTAGVS